MSLLSLLSSAQNGRFFANAGLASGLAEADAKMAISALAPAIAAQLKIKAESDPQAFDALLDLLEDGGDVSDLDDIDAMTGGEALADGADILRDLYGSDRSALKKLAPVLSADQLQNISCISATAVLAALAATQPAPVASLENKVSDLKPAKTGFLSVLLAALFKGLLQGTARQILPKRRRRRRYGYSYATGRKPARRRTRKPALNDIFDAILKNR
jgi:Bacterial protein of unknown function (DUF937)